MKQVFRFISIFLVAFICSMLFINAAPADNIQQDDLKQPRIEMTCPKCGDFGANACWKEAIDDGRTTHKYSFGTKTCTITWFISRSSVICTGCGFEIDRSGYHDCMEVHKDCGRGVYDTCFCEVS